MPASSWKDYFVFTKRDRTGVLVITVIIIILILFAVLYKPAPAAVVTKTLDEELVKLPAVRVSDSSALQEESFAAEPATESEITEPKKTTLFSFDPNTLDAAGFRRLGLTDKIIHTIINYRGKGGRFKQPDDFKKIYGLSSVDAGRLLPYIQIAAKPQQPSAAEEQQESKIYTKKTFEDKPKPRTIDINTATAEQWKALPAIGDVLSNRIIKFRNKIGGFTSIEEVKQTYGLSDSAFQAIRPYLTISDNSGK